MIIIQFLGLFPLMPQKQCNGVLPFEEAYKAALSVNDVICRFQHNTSRCVITDRFPWLILNLVHIVFPDLGNL